ncbi:hypothetical protein [Photorhabdus antumapuensis]|uniref:hypothetical protein n=1 Tax=Photorhabdus antumapuensis TaxID=2862867 RepID=UPI001CED69FB|nr:hypothetical protein [Photorhabdus antumapuensis]MCA6221863.1 hypothetical protein [Photorhabdus antumapuensis]
MSKDARAPMSSAPDEPKKVFDFNVPFLCSGFSSGRLAVHVINNQSSQNQDG